MNDRSRSAHASVRALTGKVIDMIPLQKYVGGQNVRGPYQKRGFRTREEILDAATAVFARDEPAEVTTRRIAAEADRSVGAIYQYFHDREDVLDFLAARHLEYLRSSLELLVRVHGPPRNAGDLAELLVDTFVRGCGQDPRLARVIAEYSFRLPQVAVYDQDLANAASRLVAGDPSASVDARLATRLIVLTTAAAVRAGGAAALADTALHGELVTMFRRYLSGGEHPVDGA